MYYHNARNLEFHLETEIALCGESKMSLIERDYMKRRPDNSYSYKPKEQYTPRKKMSYWHYSLRLNYFRMRDWAINLIKSTSFLKLKERVIISKSRKDYNSNGFSSSRYYDPRK